MRLRPSIAVFVLTFFALLFASHAGIISSVSLSWSRPQPETNPLVISFVLRCTWLASTMSSSILLGNSFSDGFFCPIDGQVPKCVAAQMLVVSKDSSELFTELRTVYTYVQTSCHLSPALISQFFSYSAADGAAVVASYVPSAAAPDACSASPTAPCLLNNGGASMRALAGVPLQGSAALAVWHSPTFPVLSLLQLPLQPTFQPLPFRIVVPSSDWVDAVLRSATSSEQASYIASPVGMTVSADGNIRLPQSVSAVAGGFGMYQLSFAATHASGMFSVLQHLLVRVCNPMSALLPVISFANASRDYDPAASRFTCFPRRPCVLRVIASHDIVIGNNSVINNATTVTLRNSSIAGSSHQLLLVQPGNPAVYDLVFMHFASEQQPSDADTGKEEAICLQAFASTGCPSPPTCFSVRISSRPPLVLQPTATSLASCENETVSMLFNVSNNDPLETISFRFDDLPLSLASYGITVGDTRISSDISGVQYLSFQVNLTTFSPGQQSESPIRICAYCVAYFKLFVMSHCILHLISALLLLSRRPRHSRCQRPPHSEARPTHMRNRF
jgi:hypothetical protein